MSRFDRHAGIRSCRKAASTIIGSTFLLGATAAAAAADPAGKVEPAGGAEPSEAVLSTSAPATVAAVGTGTDPIVVTGERYRINTLNSRLPDVLDAPQSISIIPRDVIEKQAATSLNDVLRNVTGISMAAGEGGGGPGGDNLTLRGFGARNDIFVDGIRDFASYARDTFNVEQVEVVKGPASAQTGRGSTGGYINLFSKQPQLGTFASGSIGLGLPGYRRATADLNVEGSALGIGGSTALRLNLLYHDADTPGRDHVETRRLGIAPSVAVGLGTSTRAILSYFRLEQDALPDYGIPFVPISNIVLSDYADRPAPVDFDNYYGLTERDYEDTATNMITFALEHDLTDAIRIANTTRYGHATRDSIYSAPRFAFVDDVLINPNTQSRDTVDKMLFNQTNLFGEFATGALRHDAIIGLELSRERSRNQLRDITAGTPTDLFDPDPDRPWDGTIVDIPGEVVRAKAVTSALYAFDTIHFSDALLFSGGLRWERFKSSFTPAPSQLSATIGPIERTDTHVTWRAGITVKPVPSLSLYAGAGTSVNPSIENMTQTTPNLSVGALKPERSRTYEVGAKWTGLDGALLLTSALFRTDKTNARTPGLAGEPATVLEGRQRVDGFEIGATGRVTKHWQLIGSYSYLDSKVLESNTETEIGNRLANVPKHSGSFWTLYQFPRGLEVGAGARYVGTRYTNVSNLRRIDDYWLADASLGYRISPKTTLQLNLRNLFDKDHIDQVGGGHFVPGAGRSAIATLLFDL